MKNNGTAPTEFARIAETATKWSVKTIPKMSESKSATSVGNVDSFSNSGDAMHRTIEINGREYECIFHVQKGERAAKENGQPLWPDTPDHIDDLEAIAYTPKGTCRVTSARTLNRIHEKLEEGL